MVNLFNKAKEAQKNLQALHEEYLSEDKKYKEIVAEYNVGREAIRDKMQLIDLEASHFDKMQTVVAAQVEEVNEQIKAL